MVRSVIDYGCFFYGFVCRTLLGRLDVLQNKALRICLGVMKSTPIEALYVEANEPLLTLRRDWFSTKFVLKVRSTTDLTNLNACLHDICIENLTNKFWEKR